MVSCEIAERCVDLSRKLFLSGVGRGRGRIVAGLEKLTWSRQVCSWVRMSAMMAGPKG